MAQLLAWLHVQTVLRALMAAPQEALCARCVQLVSILPPLEPQPWLTAAAALRVRMGLALAFLPQAIAQPVVQAFSRQHWVLSRWAPAHSVA